MRTVVNHHRWEPRNEDIPAGKSLTVPDQHVPLRKLLYQYTRGIMPGSKQPEYFGEEEIPDFSAMDLTELADYKKGLTDEINDIKAKQKAADKEAFEKRKQSVIDAEVDKRLKQMQNVKVPLQQADNQPNTQTSPKTS